MWQNVQFCPGVWSQDANKGTPDPKTCEKSSLMDVARILLYGGHRALTRSDLPTAGRPASTAESPFRPVLPADPGSRKAPGGPPTIR